MSENGITPVVISLTLSNGVAGFVTPLSLFLRDALLRQSEELYPLPDPKPYEQPIPGGRAGQVVPASQHKEYRALAQAVEARRSNWVRYRMCLVAFDVADRDEVILRFAEQREQLARIMALPENKWETTLMYCVLNRDEDVGLIMRAAQSLLPLTGGEILDGMRQFRVDLQRNAHRGNRAEEAAPGVEKADTLEA